MKSIEVVLGELILVGTFVRTNNINEMNPETAKISKHFYSYFSSKVAENFKDRCFPNVTYSIYTEYESDENGEYTHFIGEIVKTAENQNLSQFKILTIPASKYIKFTTHTGKLPDIVIEAWQYIWKTKSQALGGVRAYIADFEVYDDRSCNPESAEVDLYIGIK